METIYGDYVADAVLVHHWHIENLETKETLCGVPTSPSDSRLRLHVGRLECSTCMKMGG